MSIDFTIEDNILFIAAGVFYYFNENQIREFFTELADLFPGSEIVFDASSPIGIKMANKMVLKNSGMDVKSMLKWGLKNPNIIQLWDNSIKVIGEYLFFRDIKKRLNFKSKIYAFISDLLKMQYLVHLKVLTKK